MKLKFYSAFIATVVFGIFSTSCEKDPLPVASFTFSPTEITQYDVVTFTSTSENATSYFWDLGDGALTSTQQNINVKFIDFGAVKVKLTASNDAGKNTTEQTLTVKAPDNNYTLNGVKHTITAKFYQVPTSQTDLYLTLLTPITGQTGFDLLKIIPKTGSGVLPRTYSWAKNGAEGTFDFTYSANMAGADYAWTSIGKTGSSALVITLLDTNVYKITGTLVLSVGTWDITNTNFTETSTKTLVLNYIGEIAPLEI